MALINFHRCEKRSFCFFQNGFIYSERLTMLVLRGLQNGPDHFYTILNSLKMRALCIDKGKYLNFKSQMLGIFSLLEKNLWLKKSFRKIWI